MHDSVSIVCRLHSLQHEGLPSVSRVGVNATWQRLHSSQWKRRGHPTKEDISLLGARLCDKHSCLGNCESSGQPRIQTLSCQAPPEEGSSHVSDCGVVAGTETLWYSEHVSIRGGSFTDSPRFPAVEYMVGKGGYRVAGCVMF